MTGLGIRRLPDETWLAAALRLAGPRELGAEVLEHYERGRKRGVSEEEAALHAVRDWHVAETLEDDA